MNAPARLAMFGFAMLAGTASGQPMHGIPCAGPDPVACLKDVNAKDISGYTPLATVLFNPNREVTAPGPEARRYPKLDLVKRLLDAGARLNGDHGGWGRNGALGLARREDPEVIALLVARGATLEDTGGRGPLTVAIEMDRDDLALALLGRDRKVAPADGQALAAAARRGWGHVVTPLLAAGADPNVADAQGMTALMLAERRRDSAMEKSLVAAGARAATPPARQSRFPGGGFAAVAANEIDEVAFFDPPRFALVPGREAVFGFYGKGMNQYEQVRCERGAAYEFLAHANLTGGIQVGLCTREVRRIRELSAAAKPALESLIAQLVPGGAKLDPATIAKFGWTYAREGRPNGAEEHYFALIAIGHGLVALPTVVLVPRGARHAVLVQAETSKLCENYGLKGQTALCDNTRQALTDIARRLEARFAD